MTWIMSHLGAFFIVFFTAFFSYGNNYWWYSWGLKWFIMISVLTLALGVTLIRRVHWSLVPAFLSTSLSAIWVFAMRDNQYQGYTILDILALGKASAYGLVSFILLAAFFSTAKKNTLLALENALGWLCSISTVCVIWQFMLGIDSYHRGGFIGNASMNGCLIAFTYPFLTMRRYRLDSLFGEIWAFIWCVLPVLAVFLTGASMAVGTMGAVLMAYLFSSMASRYSLKLRLTVSAGAMLVSLLGGYVLWGKELWNPSGRFLIWKEAIKWWYGHYNIWFGTGAGTTSILLPYIQRQTNLEIGQWFLWFHNEWAQILFEQGIVGLLSFILLGWYTVKFAAGRVYLISALAGYIICSIGNYPAHMPLHALIGMALVAMAFKYKESVR